MLGFDDSPLAGLAHIQLTTIRQDSAGLASAALERLVSRLDGVVSDGSAVDIVRGPTLVVRGSTASPSSWSASM